jgi:hypothetical protein
MTREQAEYIQTLLDIEEENLEEGAEAEEYGYQEVLNKHIQISMAFRKLTREMT